MDRFLAAVMFLVLTVPVAQAQAPVAPPAVPPVASPVVPPLPRAFSAKTGLLFNTVRPERVADFEKVMGLLESALRSSTDPARRAQADGWHIYRATEPGPNGTVLYVFLLDPAVPGADYGLGRILADAYPEQVQEIWKLYQGSVTGGGSLLNLAPVGVPSSPPVPPAQVPSPTPRE